MIIRTPFARPELGRFDAPVCAGGCPVLVFRQGAWQENHSIQQDHGAR